MVSLTFDAAWGNEDTQQLIDILGKYQVKATFFVVGSWAEKYPESVKALHDAGHEVMNHSDTHRHLPELSAEEIVADVNACNDKIEAVTGVRPTLIRPPYGDYDDHTVAAIRGMGMEAVQWDVDTLAAVGIPWDARICGFSKGKLEPVGNPGACFLHTPGFYLFLPGFDRRSDAPGSEKDHRSENGTVAERFQRGSRCCQHDRDAHQAISFPARVSMTQSTVRVTTNAINIQRMISSPLPFDRMYWVSYSAAAWLPRR